MSYKAMADAVESRGRNGDTVLVHMHPAEVAGIAALTPGGLTTNPDTGKPEAFAFLIPMLGSLLGGWAGGSGMLAGLGLGSGALATGLGAAAGSMIGTGAAGGNLNDALTGGLISGLTAGTLSGLGGNSLMGAEKAATAAPAAATVPAITTTAPAAGSATGNLLGDAANPYGMLGMNPATMDAFGGLPVAAPTTMPATIPANIGSVGAISPSALGSIGSAAPTTFEYAGSAAPAALGDATTSALANPVGFDPNSMTGFNATDTPWYQSNLAKNAAIVGGLGALGYAMQPQQTDFSSTGLKKTPYIPEQQAPDYQVMFPDGSYKPGYDPEFGYFNYARQYGIGGLLGNLVNPLANAKGVFNQATHFAPDPILWNNMNQAGFKAFAPGAWNDPNYAKSANALNPIGAWLYHKSQPFTLSDFSGIFDRSSPVDNQPAVKASDAVQAQKAPTLTGYATGGQLDQAAAVQQSIIKDAEMALMGEHPEPQLAIQRFVQTFGTDALQALRQKVTRMLQQQQASQDNGRLVQGPGTGTSDSVPAVVDGQEPVKLSAGEYVLPKKTVDAVGKTPLDQLVMATNGKAPHGSAILPRSG